MAKSTYEEMAGGAHSLGSDVTPAGAVLCEIVITWILVQSVLMTAVDEDNKSLLAPLIIGSSVAVGIFAG